MQKIIVTGVKGFLGSRIVAHLKARGFRVMEVGEDVRIKERLRTYFEDADLVIHSAAETKKIDDDSACYLTNVGGTMNVIELCLEYGTKMLFFGSTARKTAYGRSKQEAQRVVQNAFKEGLTGLIYRLCPIVTLDDPLMKWGRRYPIERLVEDIEKDIREDNFNGQVIDYKKFKAPR